MRIRLKNINRVFGVKTSGSLENNSGHISRPIDSEVNLCVVKKKTKPKENK